MRRDRTKMGPAQRYLKLPTLLSVKIMQVPSNSILTVAVRKSTLQGFWESLVLLSKCCLHKFCTCSFLCFSWSSLWLQDFLHGYMIFCMHITTWVHWVNFLSFFLLFVATRQANSQQLGQARRFIFLTLATVAAQSEECCCSLESNSAAMPMARYGGKKHRKNETHIDTHTQSSIATSLEMSWTLMIFKKIQYEFLTTLAPSWIGSKCLLHMDRVGWGEPHQLQPPSVHLRQLQCEHDPYESESLKDGGKSRGFFFILE